MSNHLVNEISRQRGKFVNMLASVPRIGNAIPEIEVKGFQQPILEEMSLNHPEVFHVLVANLKLNAKRKGEARSGSEVKPFKEQTTISSLSKGLKGV